MLGRIAKDIARSSSQLHRHSSPAMLNVAVRYFSKDNGVPPSEPPESFYDANKEAELEFIDMATSMVGGGLENLTTLKGDRLDFAAVMQGRVVDTPQGMTDIRLNLDDVELEDEGYSN